MGGCHRFMKYSLFLSNLVILAGGVAILIVGSLSLANHEKFMNIIADEDYKIPSIIITAGGCFIILLSFLGCFGAIRENRCLLIFYMIILSLILILMLVVGIFLIVFKYKGSENLRQEMNKSLDKYYDQDDRYAKAWDQVHQFAKCCGVEGPSDYVKKGRKPPNSCCHQTCDNINYYTTGCFHTFQNWAGISGGVSLGIAALTLIGIVFSCGVLRGKRKCDSAEEE